MSKIYGVLLAFVVDLFILMSVFSCMQGFTKANGVSEFASFLCGLFCALFVHYYMGQRHLLRSSL